VGAGGGGLRRRHQALRQPLHRLGRRRIHGGRFAGKGGRGERVRERGGWASPSLSRCWLGIRWRRRLVGWWGVRCRGEVKLKRWLLGVMCGGGGGALYIV
jgi:hypothetical protein